MKEQRAVFFFVYTQPLFSCSLPWLASAVIINYGMYILLKCHVQNFKIFKNDIWKEIWNTSLGLDPDAEISTIPYENGIMYMY